VRRGWLSPLIIVEQRMDKNALNPEALVVESFELEFDSTSLYYGNDWKCSGCDSGCGIFPNDP
jgi:hypothetical protein